MMQKTVVFKLSEFASFLVPIIMILDGLSTVIFGFVHLIGSGNADFIEPLKKAVMIRQAEIVLVLAFIYFLVCFLSLIFWHSGGRIWTYVILGLASFHLIGSTYLLTIAPDDADSVSPLPYGSIILNLLVIVLLVYQWSKSESLARKSNA